MSQPKWKTLFSILTIGLLMSPTRVGAGERTGWDTQSAARYLDTRAKEWEAFRGADRGQAADKVSCLSCHTSVSYALGRPALRHVAGEARPTAHESRLLEQVRRRVAHWSDLDTPRFRLSYDHDERKKAESWGTEAILNALVLAWDDRRQGVAGASDTTRQALGHLWSTQLKDGKDAGSWDWLDFGARPWEATESRYYGTTLAAIAVGAAPGYLKTEQDADSRAGLERLRGYLSSHLEKQNLHNRMFALWASTSIDGLIAATQRQQIIDQVLAKQQESGGWSLSSLVDSRSGQLMSLILLSSHGWSLSALVDGRRQDGTPQETAPDGYATGLALHVLQLAGVEREKPAVARGLAWLRANQQPSGYWVGVSLNKRRDPKTHVGKFMSDAATAFAILALEDH
jgi:squalene-hopene/tetraprenyl-beta-curcumene cyclase